MFLFFGTLKNTWLFINVRIRKNFLHYYNLDTNMAKQPRIICCCDRCLNYAFLLFEPTHMK